MPIIDGLLRDVDAAWPLVQTEKVQLRVIGCTALALRTGYDRATKDGDVLETAALTAQVKQTLLALAGKDTALHMRHHLYLDIVAAGVPFLPQGPLWHPLVPDLELQHFEISVLDVVDVVVSKLKRFSANDVRDIAAMAAEDHIDPDRLVERFRSAVDAFTMDARVGDLPKYLAHLHQVQRDALFVTETEIELPPAP